MPYFRNLVVDCCQPFEHLQKFPSKPTKISQTYARNSSHVILQLLNFSMETLREIFFILRAAIDASMLSSVASQKFGCFKYALIYHKEHFLLSEPALSMCFDFALDHESNS